MSSERFEIRVGRTYRAKRPQCARGFYNDRTVLHISARGVQYDSPSVRIGRHRPRIPIAQFERWMDRDVTDELPQGKYQPWEEYPG